MPFSATGRIFQAYFYKTRAGNEPVRDFLNDQTKEDKTILGKDIDKVQIGGPAIGKPTVDGLGGGLYEIRSTIFNGTKEVRILFTIESNYLVLLHAFTKTTKKTPKHEIETARNRMANAKRR